jgi:hypothetical protein
MISTKVNQTAHSTNQHARTSTVWAASRCSAAVRATPSSRKLRAAAREITNPINTTTPQPTHYVEVPTADNDSKAHISTGTTISSSSSKSSFQWLSHWYPVHVVDSIDPTRPHSVELLGQQLVLWKAHSTVTAAAAAAGASAAGGSSAEHWQCFEDACPQRCDSCSFASATCAIRMLYYLSDNADQAAIAHTAFSALVISAALLHFYWPTPLHAYSPHVHSFQHMHPSKPCQ